MIALILTIKSPLLITIENVSGSSVKISGAKVAPTPIAILVPIILKLLFAPKSNLDKIDIPDEVITPNKASVAPPNTHFGTAVITAEIFGKIPAMITIIPAATITERLFTFVRSIRLTFSLNIVDGTELNAPVTIWENA